MFAREWKAVVECKIHDVGSDQAEGITSQHSNTVDFIVEEWEWNGFYMPRGGLV